MRLPILINTKPTIIVKPLLQRALINDNKCDELITTSIHFVKWNRGKVLIQYRKKAKNKVDMNFTSPVVWPSSYACAQQFIARAGIHSGNRGELFRPCKASLAWHSRYVFDNIYCITFETSQFIVYVIDFLEYPPLESSTRDSTHRTPARYRG